MYIHWYYHIPKQYLISTPTRSTHIHLVLLQYGAAQLEEHIPVHIHRLLNGYWEVCNWMSSLVG